MESAPEWALFRPALEASPIAILIVDPEGRIALVNRELERQFGYDQGELVGNAVEVLLPRVGDGMRVDQEDSPPGPGDAPPAPLDRELSVRRKDGSEIPVTIRSQPIRTSQGPFVLASIVGANQLRVLENGQRTALDDHIEFERFVAELSFQFINVQDDQVLDAIKNALGQVSGRLGLDRSTFYRTDAAGEVFECISWTAPGLPLMHPRTSTRELFSWTTEQLLAGRVVTFSALSEIPADTDRASYESLGTRSAVIVPLSVDGLVVGGVGFHTVRAERAWCLDAVHRLMVVASVFGQLVARQRRDEAVRAAAREVQRLRDQLQAENIFLRQEERERLGLTRVVGQSPAIRRVLDQIGQVAPTDATVLLLGETGTGKELFASYLHELGTRHARAMVRVNCASIPTTLIESELFGREKGAFTGSLARQVGRFELADHSTIFLDEIGDLPPDVQVKLLRVLEERTIERLGSPRPILVDVRIIAATHRNLEQRIAEGAFREDLYYRLNVFPIVVPPLRDRIEDIPLLLWRFVEEFSKAFGKRIDSIDKDSVAALQRYAWPGNIRELRNVVERAMIVTTSRRLVIPSPQASPAAAKRSPRLIDVEKEHIRGVLEATGWRIRGTGGAADRLGLKPTTLETRMAKLGLKRLGHR